MRSRLRRTLLISCTVAVLAGGAGIGLQLRAPRYLVQFLGTTDGAERIAFVCDGDGSMLNIIANLTDALNQSVGDLQPGQKFNILLSGNGGFVAMDPQTLRPATAANKKSAKDYLADYTMSGATDEAGAVALALKQRPQVIFLALSGDTPDNAGLLETIRRLNASHQVRIHTISVCNSAAYPEDARFPQLMQQISTENAGTYRAVDLSLWPPPLARSHRHPWRLIVLAVLPLVMVVPMM